MGRKFRAFALAVGFMAGVIVFSGPLQAGALETTNDLLRLAASSRSEEKTAADFYVSGIVIGTLNGIHLSGKQSSCDIDQRMPDVVRGILTHLKDQKHRLGQTFAPLGIWQAYAELYCA